MYNIGFLIRTFMKLYATSYSVTIFNVNIRKFILNLKAYLFMIYAVWQACILNLHKWDIFHCATGAILIVSQ